MKHFNEFTGEHYNVRFSKKFTKMLANYSGFSPRDIATELTDNAHEAGATEVVVSMMEPHVDATLIVSDNGKGMDENDVHEKLFQYGEGDDEKKGIHAHTGGKNAIAAALTGEHDYAEIFTKKEGCKTVHVIWDGSNEYTVDKSDNYEEMDAPGTKILLYSSLFNPNYTAIVVNEFKRYARIRYFFPLTEGSLTLRINGLEIKGEHPLYPELEDPSGVQTTFTAESEVIGPKDGVTYIVPQVARNLMYFWNEKAQQTRGGMVLHESDIDDDGNCLINNIDKSGVYIKVGDLIIVAGGTVRNYISRKEHNAMNGKRILIDMPVGLARQLQFHMNKGKGFSGFKSHPSLIGLSASMKETFEKAIQQGVQESIKEDTKKVAGYKNEKHIGDKKGKHTQTIKFKILESDRQLPKEVFASRTKVDDGVDVIEFNRNSEVLSKIATKPKEFSTVANVIENMYVIVMETINDLNAFQPTYEKDDCARAASKNAKDQTLSKVKEVFIEKFLSLRAK